MDGCMDRLMIHGYRGDREIDRSTDRQPDKQQTNSGMSTMFLDGH